MNPETLDKIMNSGTKYRYQIVYPDGKTENIDMTHSLQGKSLSEVFEERTGLPLTYNGINLKAMGYKLLYIGPVEDESKST